MVCARSFQRKALFGSGDLFGERDGLGGDERGARCDEDLDEGEDSFGGMPETASTSAALSREQVSSSEPAGTLPPPGTVELEGVLSDEQPESARARATADSPKTRRDGLRNTWNDTNIQG